MTDDAITARNRANAQKSTGPRTAEGKAVVAHNARRHGATARPNPERVAAWLAIILDRPDLTPGDFMPEEEAGYRALALAEAEVRLIAADQALQDFEAGRAEPDGSTQELREIGQGIMEDLIDNGGTQRELRSAISLLNRAGKLEAQETRPGGQRHRLLKRYAGEARAQRKKAFAAWAAMRAEQEAIPW